jgi:hypothetical protein
MCIKGSAPKSTLGKQTLPETPVSHHPPLPWDVAAAFLEPSKRRQPPNAHGRLYPDQPVRTIREGLHYPNLYDRHHPSSLLARFRAL